MSQFDYLRDQISNNIWAGKEILEISDTVTGAIDSGREWYLNLPHIKFVMETPVMSGIAGLLEASADLADTVVDANLVFLETLHGINRAFNSKEFRNNLAGKGNTELAKIINSTREQSIYQNAVTAHNETLNLPALSVQVAEIEQQIAAIEQQGESATQQIEDWKNKAIIKLEEAKNSLLQLIETLKGNPRRNARRQMNIADAGLTAMRTGNVPDIIASNPYSIDSITKYNISSIYRTNIQANAIVLPIAVGGAATVAGAATVLTGIAGWLLGSFFLKTALIPATLLPALTNTVVSIVLKIVGSSGTEAVRYFAASALKAGQNLLPIIFSPTGMRASGWAWLMAFAAPIIGASVIIIQAMRNKLGLAKTLLVFGDFENSKGRFNFSESSMYDTNRVEILETFKKTANSMYDRARVEITKITGLGLDEKGKYAVCYDLTNPQNPILISGKEAIETFLGPDKVARIASNRLGFMDFI